MAVNLGYTNKRKRISERTYLDVVKERLASSKELFYLLYSQLNPVFFLVILKPFQKKFLSVLKKATHTNEKRKRVIRNQQNHQPNPKLKSEVSQNNIRFFKKLFWFFSVTIFLLSTSSIMLNAKICVDESIDSTQAKDDCFASKIQTQFLQEKQVLNFLFLQESFSAKFEDPRLKCGVLRGSLDMNNERCCFSVKHSLEKELNLTEQAELCRSQNATLAYPTSFEEAGFLFRFYLFECGSDCRKNVRFRMNEWFIRLGFQRISTQNGIVFSTFDGNLVVENKESFASGFNSYVDGNSSIKNGSEVDNDYEYDYDYE